MLLLQDSEPLYHDTDSTLIQNNNSELLEYPKDMMINVNDIYTTSPD